MELNQIVYVVNDSKEQRIIGVYNDFQTAKWVALDMNKLTYDGSEISITPVLVDSVNWETDSRKYCLTESDVLDAVQEEIELAMPEDDDDEDDDEYDDEYSDEDEDEEDDDYDEDDDDDDDDESDSEDVVYTAIDRITDAILEIEKILDDLKDELDDQ